jgi:PAS domain S-box-containing protein
MSKALIGARRVGVLRSISFARSRRSMRLAMVAYVAFAAVALPMCLLDDSRLSWVGFLMASALPLVGLPIGIRLFRPASALPWLLLWAGQVAFFLGDLLLFGDEQLAGSGWAAGANIAYLVGYPLTALGLGYFIHRRLPAERLAPLVDAVAVGVAGIMVLWLVHVEPLIHDSSLELGETLVILGYPVGDVLLLGAVAYLVLAARATGAASRLVAASIGLLLLADVLSATHLSDPSGEAGVDLLWALSYVLLGVAALVPSMRELTEPAPAVATNTARRHEILLLTALLVLPVAAVAQVLLVGHLDAAVILVAALALAAMLLLSIHDGQRQATRRERRWATMLAKASDAFAITAADGRLTFISPASERIIGSPFADYVGRSVLELASLVHPDDRAGPGARLAAAMRAPGATAGERLRVRAPDGGVHWLEIVVRNLVDDPDVGGVVLNYRDVTTEVQAGLELERRDHLLAASEALAHVGSSEWHLDSGRHVWSQGMWALLGVEPGSAPSLRASTRTTWRGWSRRTPLSSRTLAPWPSISASCGRMGPPSSSMASARSSRRPRDGLSASSPPSGTSRPNAKRSAASGPRPTSWPTYARRSWSRTWTVASPTGGMARPPCTGTRPRR